MARKRKTPTNVYRIDIQPSDAFPNRHPTHGWQVRIRRQGKQHTKFFSDDKYGSKKKALDKAVGYRDDLLKELPEPDDPLAKSARARTKTGVIGLSFCTKDDGSGQQKPYVQLSWMIAKGKRKTASFSVEKWGMKRAIWKACERLYNERQKLGHDSPSPEEMFKIAYPSIVKQHTGKNVRKIPEVPIED